MIFDNYLFIAFSFIITLCHAGVDILEGFGKFDSYTENGEPIFSSNRWQPVYKGQIINSENAQEPQKRQLAAETGQPHYKNIGIQSQDFSNGTTINFLELEKNEIPINCTNKKCYTYTYNDGIFYNFKTYEKT